MPEHTGIAGQQMRAYAFFCAGCTKETFYFSQHITAAKAARLARQDGWSKKASGWHCPTCQQTTKEE